MDSCESGGERVNGTPVFGREESETDFAGREGDVRVGYPSGEMDCRRCEGVVWGNGDAEVPQAAFVGLVWMIQESVRSLSGNCTFVW